MTVFHAPGFLNRLVSGESLTQEETDQFVCEIMQGKLTDVTIAGFLTALACKGPAASELAGAARAMRKHVVPLKPQSTPLLDTCGTGGDGQATFNISTAAAIVVAAAGCPVAKHGNRSVTSLSGSADVLEAMGVRLDLPPSEVARCIDEVGIGFCFAPLFHNAMKHVATVRKQLGIRTIFNLLGPLTNPAGAQHQVLGVSKPHEAALVAEALSLLGTGKSAVICGDRIDEVSLWGQTQVWIVEGSTIHQETWNAAQLGLPECRVEDLKVANPQESAALIWKILDGEAGAPAHMVTANAAVGLWLAGKAPDLISATQLAREAIQSGRALSQLKSLVAWTNTYSNSK